VKNYNTYLENESIHKVAVYIQDDQHTNTVYVKIAGNTHGKYVLDESINEVLYGEIYTDMDCLQLLQDEYIEIYKFPRRKKDFVYLIERKFAENYIVGVRIIDHIFVE
jgi:hypothetical protein